MKIKTLFILFFCLSSASLLRAAEGTASLPPFIYTGRIVNYDNANYADAVSGGEIRARKNGVLIARSAITKATNTLCNYSLVIPMSNLKMANAAQTGDKLTFEIDPDGVAADIYKATNSFVAVGAPGRVARVNICASTDSNGDGVSDQYASDISGLMDIYGVSGPFDPAADYDGDGVSNYEEYLAGTDPFNSADTLSFLSIAMVPENDEVVKVTFLPGKMRAYTVQQATNEIARTGGSDYHQRPFQLEGARSAQKNEFLQTGSEDAEVRTLYLLKDGASSQFYRLHLE